MKKLFALLLCFVLIFSFTACSGNEAKLEGVNAPVDILNTVWTSYAENELFFALGGDYESAVDNAPGAVALTSTDFLSSNLVCTENSLPFIDGAASLIHAMNANTFTGAAYHLADKVNKSAFIESMKNDIEGNRWMCGFPEKLIIASLTDSYIVVAFGNGEIVDNFKNKLSAAYNVTVIEVEENIE